MFPLVTPSLTHCSLSTLSEKLLGHLGRNWNSSKISMYRKNRGFYRNQRLTWTIKVSYSAPISVGFAPKSFDSSFLNNSSNEFSITGLPRRDRSNGSHSLEVHPRSILISPFHKLLLAASKMTPAVPAVFCLWGTCLEQTCLHVLCHLFLFWRRGWWTYLKFAKRLYDWKIYNLVKFCFMVKPIRNQRVKLLQIEDKLWAWETVQSIGARVIFEVWPSQSNPSSAAHYEYDLEMW